MDIWPVYVPSKGRAGKAKIPTVQTILVVEPQEAESYRSLHQDVAVVQLPESSQGIAYVREWIKEQATTQGHEWYWTIDDDVRAYYEIIDGKSIKAPAEEVLRSAQEKILGMKDVGQAGLEYQQFAWSARREVALNSYCDVVVAINTRRTKGLHYRSMVDMKEDRDFTIQVLMSGWQTARLSRLAFACPRNGSNKGGLSHEYGRQGRERQAAEALMALWPGVVGIQVKKSGRVDAKINWRLLAKRRSTR